MSNSDLAWDFVLSGYLMFPICLHWISLVNLMIDILCEAEKKST
jgi:hypothetical protein